MPFNIHWVAALLVLFHPIQGGWARAAETGLTALVHVNLVPMTAEKVIPDQCVLVDGRTIAHVGPCDGIELPATAAVIDGTGAFLMPGLADMHMHVNKDWETGAWPVSPFRLYLANGVTTIRCLGPIGKKAGFVLQWRDQVAAGKRIGPTLYSCGKTLRGPVRNPIIEVRRQKAWGFDFIKLYSYLSPTEFADIMETARLTSMYTVGHIPFQVGLDRVVQGGMNEIAHVEELLWELVDFSRTSNVTGAAWLPYVIRTAFDQLKPWIGADPGELETAFGNRISGLAARLQEAQIPVDTTLIVDDTIVQKLFDPSGFLTKSENRYLPESYLDAFRRGQEKHQRQFRGGEVFAHLKYQLDLMLLKQLKAKGIPLLLGTDAGTGGMGIVPGISVHRELQILCGNGFSPYQAIATATRNISKPIDRMGGEEKVGTIEAGSRADLILVDGNPLADVANIQNIRGVMTAGRWFNRKALEDMTALPLPERTQSRPIAGTVPDPVAPNP